MPAFSHFFLKRLSARSKFSSSWIMTSDKFYFPPSWRLCAGMGQTVKPRRRTGLGQAKPPLRLASSTPLLTADHCRYVGGGPLRPHTRSGGAPHYAPSLRSVAGLLGRSLDAACEDLLRLPIWMCTNCESRVAPHVATQFCLTPLRRPRIAGRATLGRPATKWGSALAGRAALTRRGASRRCGERVARAVTILYREARVSSEGHPQQEPAVWARQRAPTAGVRGHCPAEDTLTDRKQRCSSKRG